MNYEIVEKIQDADAALEDMRFATDARRFRRAFTHCLACVRSIEYKLEGMTTRKLRKSGRKRDIPEFREWWTAQLAIARDDELLQWAQRARDTDTHIADGQGVQFGYSTSIEHIASDDLEPGPPGASFIIAADGMYWVVNEGTAAEKRIPARPRAGTPSAAAKNTTELRLDNPPRTHLGESLTTTDPIELCEIAVRYWERLAQETFDKWWGPSSL